MGATANIHGIILHPAAAASAAAPCDYTTRLNPPAARCS